MKNLENEKNRTREQSIWECFESSMKHKELSKHEEKRQFFFERQLEEMSKLLLEMKKTVINVYRNPSSKWSFTLLSFKYWRNIINQTILSIKVVILLEDPLSDFTKSPFNRIEKSNKYYHLEVCMPLLSTFFNCCRTIFNLPSFTWVLGIFGGNTSCFEYLLDSFPEF